MTTDWVDLVQETVEWFQAEVEMHKKEIVDDILPSLLERSSPDKRLALYDTLDFDRLLAADPYIWSKLSKDAQTLAEQRKQKEQDAMRERERQNFVANKLLAEQLHPFGIRGSEADTLGLNTPMDNGLYR